MSEEQMDKLYNLRKDNATFLDTINNSTRIALFGAGFFGVMACRYLKKMRYNVCYFVDNSELKQARCIEGLEVIGRNALGAVNVDIVMITPKDFNIIEMMKKELGDEVKYMTFDEWFVFNHLDKYSQIISSVFKDELSKHSLYNLLMAMLTQESSYCEEIFTQNQYYCLPHFTNSMNEILVDVGAYVGDSLERFIWSQGGAFVKIYAFEPGKKQFNAMVERKRRLIKEWALEDNSIELINAGVADKCGSCSTIIGENDILQAITLSDVENESNISLYSLDERLHGVKVSFIKADIEGMELLMLRGASELIVKNKPKIAICIYHRNTDLFDIIEYLKELVPLYNFGLRHHSSTLMESVLYAWV